MSQPTTTANRDTATATLTVISEPAKPGHSASDISASPIPSSSLSSSSASSPASLLPPSSLVHHLKQQQPSHPQGHIGLSAQHHAGETTETVKRITPAASAATPVRRSLVKEFALGGIATSAACLFTNPIEVVKTRLQVQGELSARAGRESSASGPYRNWAHALYTVGRLEGVRGLWAGIGPAVLYQLSMNGTRLGSYEHFKRMYINLIDQLHTAMSPSSASSSSSSSPSSHSSHSQTPKMLPNVLAGATAGAVAAVLGSPFFLLKVRLQTQFKKTLMNPAESAHPPATASTHPSAESTSSPPSSSSSSSSSTSSSSADTSSKRRSVTVGHQYAYRSSLDAFRQILSTEGVIGLFHGVQAAVARVSIGSAVQLSTYDYSKHLVMSYTGIDGTAAHFSASLVTGLFVTLAMNPPDVLTTRMYNQPFKDGKPLLYKGLWDCLTKTIRAEGPFALYKGFVAHYARLGPHTILTFVFWEKVKKFADQFGW